MPQSECRSPLSEKDLAYVKDHLSWELLAAKKAYQYAYQTTDQDVRTALFDVSKVHQRNYETLLAHLGGHAAATLQAMAQQTAQMPMGQMAGTQQTSTQQASTQSTMQPPGAQ